LTQGGKVFVLWWQIWAPLPNISLPGEEGGLSQPACTLWKRNHSFAHSGNRIRIPRTTIL
jgi:hypothetical protein